MVLQRPAANLAPTLPLVIKKKDLRKEYLILQKISRVTFAFNATSLKITKLKSYLKNYLADGSRLTDLFMQ
jgi:hypothetical protein